MIKLTQLKKKLIKDTLILAGALAVVGGITAWGVTRQYSTQSALDELKNQSQREISDAQKAQQEYEETVAAFNRFKTIPKHRLPADDFDTIQSRIRAVRPVIEVLETRYRLTQLDVKISKIDDPVPVEQDPSYLLISSDLTIQFQAPTDEFVFSFIHMLIDQLPGYLYLKDLDISREEQITTKLLQQISASRSPVPLVKGTLTLGWKTLKKKPNDTTAQNGNPNGAPPGR